MPILLKNQLLPQMQRQILQQMRQSVLEEPGVGRTVNNALDEVRADDLVP